MKKRMLIIIISSIVAVIATITLVLVFTLKKPAETPENNDILLDSARSIKIVQIDGNANVTDGETESKCFKGMNLYDGDTLSVLENSKIVIKFDSDKYVYLGENTIIKIKSEGSDKYKTNVFVTQGNVLAEIQNKLGLEEEFFLSSNNSVMAVRGTIFGLGVKIVGDEIIQSYSVYKGATELFVFDKNGDNLISGKLSDISNSKLEIRIPRSHLLTEEEINNAVGKWLESVKSRFTDPTDANEKLDEVQITVSKPTQEDFEKAANIIIEKEEENPKVDPKPTEPTKTTPTTEPTTTTTTTTEPTTTTTTTETTTTTSTTEPTDPIVYSDIEYESNGYFGEYDGNGHGITVTPVEANAVVTYKGEDEDDYKAINDYLFYAPGSYRVYYKIECEGYKTKEDYEVVYITKPTIKLTSDYLTYDSASSSSVLNLSGLENPSFNRYNGVLFSDIMSNANYFINGTDVTNKVTKVEYNKIIDNYIELMDGKNTLNVTFTFDDFTMTTDVYFLFSDTREDLGYLVGALDNNLEYLSGNLYYFNDSSFIAVEDRYKIDGNDLLTAFGLDVQDLTTMLINYPSDTLGNDISNYDGTNQITLDGEKYVELNFLVFPTSLSKGFNDTVYVYVGPEAPVDYPVYTITKTKYSYNPDKTPDGVLMNFVDSTNQVLYSLDGETYQENLKIATEGSNKVYYKVTKDQEVITGYEYITIIVGQGSIVHDNSKFITNPVHIFSNDNNSLEYNRVMGTENISAEVISNDGRTITSLNDAYEIYSNMIKNASFYDSITNEPIEATVTISEKKANSANFNYTITAKGYDMVSGTVRFVYSELGDVEVSSQQLTSGISVTLPIDYTVSLSEVPTVIPSRISTSMENVFINYQEYYSIDEGKTWTTSTPKITEVGEYRIYTLYCFVDQGNDATDLVSGELSLSSKSALAANGNFIIAVQNITVTE